MHHASARFSTPSDGTTRRFVPAAALLLALLQGAGIFASASSVLQSSLAIAPEAIYRRGEVWRLIGGPLIAHEFSWFSAAFAVVAVLLFGWHIELTQGRRRLLFLFLGGTVFAASLWSVAALV